MEDPNKKKKVLCPVTKEGKTYWMKMGIAFVNKDNSLNVYLDCLPTNGKLHVRDWDDGPGERRPYGKRDEPVLGTASSEDLPF